MDGQKRDSVGLGGMSLQAHPSPSSLISWQVSTRLRGWTKVGSFLWWPTLKLPPIKRLIQTTFMEHEKLRRRRQWSHLVVTLWTAKLKATSFFPLRKLKGNQPTKTPAVWLAHLEEETTNDEEDADSEDPDGFGGMTEEFMVCLTEWWRMHSKKRNAATTAAAQIILSGIVCWWNQPERNQI